MRVRADLATARRVHALAGRVLVELGLLGVVLVGGRTVPLDEAPGTQWSFLAPFLLFVSHVLLGLLVLVDAGRLALGGLDADQRGLVVAGCGVALVCVATGAASLLDLVDRSPAPLMVLGWLVAVAAFGRLWTRSGATAR